MGDFEHVMPRLYSRLSNEYGTVGRFFFDSDSGTITAISRNGSGLSMILTDVGEGIRVDLGLGLTLVIPRDDPFELSDVLAPVGSLIENGITLHVPLEPGDDPVLRYTLEFPGGALSSRIPGREYTEFTVGGWSPFFGSR
ncbi:hypothetical protein [Nocardia amamiensis]|uniref:hypothetical protein n=1 Tax=Nocardia amamiensis TaxID=404578 RepID=UPI00083708C2|nr:hypothetical protein [Nocardia amamiensis]